MTNTDPRAAAIEAAAEQILAVTPGGDMRGAVLAAERAVAAAVPHLTAGLRALASGWVGTHDRGDAYAAEVWQVLDALERGGDRG